MVSEKTIASLLVLMLGKTAPGDRPQKPRPPAPEIAAPAVIVKGHTSQHDAITDYGSRRGPAALAASRALRGRKVAVTQSGSGRATPRTVSDRNARLNEHYRRLEASRPRND